MDATNPTSRALMCLEALQDSPGITADRLAARLGVSDRAARRYVAILREAGIPVKAERGPYGGYRLGRGLRLPPLMFTDVEALGLVMAVLDGHHDASGAQDPVGSALAKLLRALPENVAHQAESVRRITSTAPDRAAARPDPVIATTLVQACKDNRQVRIGYRSESGSEWSTTVDPLAVVVRHGRWYLLCRTGRTQSDQPDRTYRIDRIGNVEVLHTTFLPIVDLDPVSALEQNLAVGWEYEVEVIVDAPLDTVIPCLPRTLGVLAAVDENTTRLTGSTSNPWWYVEQLAVLPTTFRILKCPEVQAAARTVGNRLLAAAGGRTAG